MNEIDEIKLIENEAFLDDAIQKCLTLMREMLAMRQQIDQKIRHCEVRYGELLVHKALFSVVDRQG